MHGGGRVDGVVQMGEGIGVDEVCVRGVYFIIFQELGQKL